MGLKSLTVLFNLIQISLLEFRQSLNSAKKFVGLLQKSFPKNFIESTGLLWVPKFTAVVFGSYNFYWRGVINLNWSIYLTGRDSYTVFFDSQNQLPNTLMRSQRSNSRRSLLFATEMGRFLRLISDFVVLLSCKVSARRTTDMLDCFCQPFL